MSWVLRRKIFFTLLFLATLFVVIFLLVFPSLRKTPSCMNGIQDGTEIGVDCGGGCERACLFEADRISIIWSRAFKVLPGRYNAVAYLENHNRDKMIEKIKYRFRFADKDNVYIGKREGEAMIPSSGLVAIFEPAVGTGNSIPVYTTFEFTEMPVWKNVPIEVYKKTRVSVSGITLENEELAPRLSALVSNESLFDIPNVEIVAIIYGQDGNALSSSKTHIDILRAEEKRNIAFTWPEPFEGIATVKEIIPMYDVFSVDSK